MFGLPAAAQNVGNQSSPETMPFSTLPAGTLPGQRMIIGTRKPPSSAVPLPPAKGVWPPSGQVKFSAPLSVLNARIVLSSSPSSSSYFITAPTMSSSCAMPASWIVQPFCGVAHLLVLLGKMRHDVHARGIEPDEERLVVLLGLVDELDGASRISSSTVSIRFG